MSTTTTTTTTNSSNSLFKKHSKTSLLTKSLSNPQISSKNEISSPIYPWKLEFDKTLNQYYYENLENGLISFDSPCEVNYKPTTTSTSGFFSSLKRKFTNGTSNTNSNYKCIHFQKSLSGSLKLSRSNNKSNDTIKQQKSQETEQQKEAEQETQQQQPQQQTHSSPINIPTKFNENTHQLSNNSYEESIISIDSDKSIESQLQSDYYYDNTTTNEEANDYDSEFEEEPIEIKSFNYKYNDNFYNYYYNYYYDQEKKEDVKDEIRDEGRKEDSKEMKMISNYYYDNSISSNNNEIDELYDLRLKLFKDLY
ncbi:uncharacterized protein KGF55_005090 [Candida pseudojiufengensis]|uniref:uncharacterized protein n=1 Tax=Candida pseudojiufengensis TaxID=497109 RepID=UPI0022259DF5|nr:uncharacterized protein KGF55_005090 [Candida pseudojiufengensis]KAI5959858.1 hypothetical protein KGF55_005090 [Candida pseudojiufengensis]